MTSNLAYKIEEHRRLCLQKDLKELSFWIHTLEYVNSELNNVFAIEKQLIKLASVSVAIQAIRRKNVLNMASLCKYEQELKTEFEYGKIEYDNLRLKVHEQKRESYMKFINEYNSFKDQFYLLLKQYHRK